MKNISFKSVSFKRLDNPTQDEFRRSYICVLNIKQLPLDLGKWTKVNPRDPNPRSDASKEMTETLEQDSSVFFLRNRGILVFAKNVRYSNKDEEVSFELEDDNLHGLGDGRHTFSVIEKYLEEHPDFNEAAFVRLEIIEGLKDPQEVISIVDARNTAKEVASESLLDLAGKFNYIKSAVAQEHNYANDISYKEYETYDKGHSLAGDKKPVSIRTVIKVTTALDPRFDLNNPFLYSYTSAEKALNEFKENEKHYSKLAGLTPKFLHLHDLIRAEVPNLYTEKNREDLRIRKNRSNQEILRFLQDRTESYRALDKLEFRLPQSYLFPIISAFRFLLKETRNGYDFSKDPSEIFEKSKQEISVLLLAAAKRNGFNPNATGKDAGLWISLALIVQKNMN